MTDAQCMYKIFHEETCKYNVVMYSLVSLLYSLLTKVTGVIVPFAWTNPCLEIRQAEGITR